MAAFGLLRRRALVAAALLALVSTGGVVAPALAATGTGSITGTVTRPADLELLCVDVWPVGASSASTPAGSSCEIGQPDYTITGLPTGDYIVRFSSPEPLFSAIPTYYPGVERRVVASGVHVDDGVVTSLVDGTLDFPGLGTATVSITSEPASPVVGQAVTLTVLVNGVTVPTGSVDIESNQGNLGNVELVNGVATIATTFATAGSQVELAAYYWGDVDYDSNFALQNFAVLPLPAVGVNPSSGATTGGSKVLISGTGFTGATAVQFGTVAATGFTVLSATQITATAPAHARGAADVKVTTTAGVVVAAPFTYVDYVGMTPVRVMDDPFVAPDLVQCVAAGVPAGATSVALNVTTVGPDGPGNVIVYPDTDGDGATAPPKGSTVNFDVGADVANAAFVQLPANGRICYSSRGAGNVGVLLDVTGYTIAGSGITTQPSVRLLDSRPGDTHVGSVTGPLEPLTATDVDIAGLAGVPDGATGVLLNVTVTGAQSPGNLRVFPQDATEIPDASVVNYAPGKDKANATIVALPASGKITLYSVTDAGTSTNPINVILDVVGYTSASSSYVPVVPTRVMDTRAGTRVGPIAGPIDPLTVYALPVSGVPPVPANAVAVVLNVTAISPTGFGNLRVYPDTAGGGTTLPPDASTINYIPGSDIPNLVVVPLPTDGKVDFYSAQNGGSVQIAADVVGYIAGS